MKEKQAIFAAIYKAYNLMQNSQTHQVQGESEDAYRVLSEAKQILLDCVHSTNENSGIFTNIVNDPYIWER